MHLPSTILACFLFFGLGAHAGLGPDVKLGLGQLYRQQPKAYDMRPWLATAQASRIRRRQEAPSLSADAPAPTTTIATSNGTDVDPQAWDAETEAACDKVVRELNGQAVSQFGVAVCYNLPSFDSATGAFTADLRLYRVAPAQGAWADIDDDDVMIGLSYTGASVSDSNGVRKRDVGSASIQKRQEQEPIFLWSNTVRGQLNSTYLDTPMNLTELVTLLAPNVTLSAFNAEEQPISTTLTSKEASFVNGVFASSPVGAASARMARPTPFVLPGVTLGKFPTSLVISSTWALLGIALMTWGTVGRYQYRQQYRRRKMRERLAAMS
ncbi:MAG: hypothetical protein M1815_002220 [Lichina confinis]|nr:MAG: hypothetical protein M1815_002220 [Lichina confinis]